METLFFFIDETVCEETKIASLVTIKIPQDSILDLRDKFFNIYSKILYEITLKTGKKTIMMPPELHGKDFLRYNKNDVKTKYLEKITDEFRLEIFDDIVGFINANKISIARFGYTHKDKMVQEFKSDHNLYGDLFLGLTSFINNLAKDHYIIPVMDLVDVKKYKYITSYLWSGISKKKLYPDLDSGNPFYSNANNFILSTVFANSEHNEFIQIVDIIAYLFRKRDLQNKRGKISDFSSRLVEAFNRINPELIFEEITTLKNYE